MGKYKPRKPLKIGFGSVLGSIWERVGTVLGLFWELLGLQVGAKLAFLVSQGLPQSIQNPIICPRCFPRGSKVAPKSSPSSILELLGLDFEASGLDFKASGARFHCYFGTTGRKKEIHMESLFLWTSCVTPSLALGT